MVKVSHYEPSKHRGGGTGITLPTLDPGARWWWVVTNTPHLFYPM